MSNPVDDLNKYGPFRLCCGQRHFGPQCPDGKVMCCICYDRTDISNLSIDPATGKLQDVCIPCYQKEQERMKARG